jgi:hypothetical protein
VAGEVPPRTDRWPDLEAGGHDQADDPVDPRAHALEHLQNIQPIDPVALGLCKQTELDAAVQKANAKKAKEAR